MVHMYYELTERMHLLSKKAIKITLALEKSKIAIKNQGKI